MDLRTYNDTLVSQVTNTILIKDLKCILPMVEMEISLDGGNGNRSCRVGLLQEEASSSRLGRRCLPGATHSPSRTPVVGLP